GLQVYVDLYKAEFAKIQADFVFDNGTGCIIGIGLQGRDELRDLWTSMFVLLAELGFLVAKFERKIGIDHLLFEAKGVSSFNYDQVTCGYNHTHHSQVDDYDHVVLTDVAQAATIMAVNVWQLANLPQLLPRR